MLLNANQVFSAHTILMITKDSDITHQSQNKFENTVAVNIIIFDRFVVLKLHEIKDYSLLIRWDALLILYFLLYFLNGSGLINFHFDGLSSLGLYFQYKLCIWSCRLFDHFCVNQLK